jgi:hypothetical protein
MSFRTGSGYISISRNSFVIPPPLTVSLWIKMHTAITNGRGIYSMGANSGIMCLQVASNKVRMYVREKTPVQWQYCESTSGLNLEQWYHFCQVITANTMHFYINAVDQNAISPGGYGGDITYPDSYHFELGRYSAGTPPDITIEDFSFWKRELTTAEITLLAKSFKKRIPLQIA